MNHGEEVGPDALSVPIGGYRIDVLFKGYPGKAVHHGGLGWSTVALLRGHGRTALIDTGPFGFRRDLVRRLADEGVASKDVTDVILTHGHHDHMVNFPMFESAQLYIGALELDWALRAEAGVTPVPELYVRELANSRHLTLLYEGDEPIPGFRAILAPGHTPGSLIFVLSGEGYDVIFTGDAAKSRAELISYEADMTLDAAQSSATIDMIWKLWRRRPGNIVIPGHDVPMTLEDGTPTLMRAREGGIAANFGVDLRDVTVFELT